MSVFGHAILSALLFLHGSFFFPTVFSFPPLILIVNHLHVEIFKMLFQLEEKKIIKHIFSKRLLIKRFFFLTRFVLQWFIVKYSKKVKAFFFLSTFNSIFIAFDMLITCVTYFFGKFNVQFIFAFNLR